MFRQTIVLKRDDLPKGIYLVNLRSNKGICQRKIAIGD